MSEKKGMQTAANVIAKGQYGSGSGGIFVMPKTEVTKVKGLGVLARGVLLSVSSQTYMKNKFTMVNSLMFRPCCTVISDSSTDFRDS